jgi:hypothetical protein
VKKQGDEKMTKNFQKVIGLGKQVSSHAPMLGLGRPGAARAPTMTTTSPAPAPTQETQGVRAGQTSGAGLAQQDAQIPRSLTPDSDLEMLEPAELAARALSKVALGNNVASDQKGSAAPAVAPVQPPPRPRPVARGQQRMKDTPTSKDAPVPQSDTPSPSSASAARPEPDASAPSPNSGACAACPELDASATDPKSTATASTATSAASAKVDVDAAVDLVSPTQEAPVGLSASQVKPCSVITKLFAQLQTSRSSQQRRAQRPCWKTRVPRSACWIAQQSLLWRCGLKGRRRWKWPWTICTDLQTSFKYLSRLLPLLWFV